MAEAEGPDGAAGFDGVGSTSGPPFAASANNQSTKLESVKEETVWMVSNTDSDGAVSAAWRTHQTLGQSLHTEREQC